MKYKSRVVNKEKIYITAHKPEVGAEKRPIINNNTLDKEKENIIITKVRSFYPKHNNTRG